MYDENTKLKIVRLMDPTLCASCRFASVANVEMADGANRKMLHCKRLDCDNWEFEAVSEEPRKLIDAD